MKWRIVDKANSTAPVGGNYSQWKPQLSREGGAQCVYCCIPESKFGGIRNFHVEHYRPKSIFPELTNVYGNLFYACGVCNVFKSDDWPSDPENGKYDVAYYPDPSIVDYCNFLEIDEFSGLVMSKTLTGKYLIERLHLNRPQMIGLRAVAALFSRIDAATNEIQELLQAGAIPESDKDEVVGLLICLYNMARKYSEARPYGPEQLR